MRLITSDPRFHLITARLLTSTNQPFYLGNQTEGRLRDFLKTRCHLNVQTLPRIRLPVFALSWGAPPQREVAQPSWLVLQFTLPRDPLNASIIFVEMRDPAGNKVPVSGPFGSSANQHWQILDLDADRYRAGNYRVRVMQAGLCVAEFELRDLPRVRHTSL